MKQLPFVPTDWTISKRDFLSVLSIIMFFSLGFLSSSWISSKMGAFSEQLSGSDFSRYICKILKLSVRKRSDGQKQGDRKQTRRMETMRQVPLKISLKRAFRKKKRVRPCLLQQNIQVLEQTFKIIAFQITYGEGPAFSFRIHFGQGLHSKYICNILGSDSLSNCSKVF